MELKNWTYEEFPEFSEEVEGAPWTDEVPALSVYDWRGCRMLDKSRWKGKCFTCKLACMANVTIEYNWGVTQKFRFETFCYGPKNCSLYKMGRPRAVPYKDCGSSYDEGWLDDICTENRGDDEQNIEREKESERAPFIMMSLTVHAPPPVRYNNITKPES